MANVQEETENFYRGANILLDLCGKILRELLEVHVSPAACPPTVRPSKQARLSNEQKDIIKNIKNVGSYEECDVSLLYSLFLNFEFSTITPTKPWGQTNSHNYIDPTFVTCGDDVERIRLQRNALIAHVANTRMSNNDYANLVVEMTSIITRFDSSHGGTVVKAANCGAYVKELQQIQSRPLNGDLTQVKADIVKLFADISKLDTEQILAKEERHIMLRKAEIESFMKRANALKTDLALSIFGYRVSVICAKEHKGDILKDSVVKQLSENGIFEGNTIEKDAITIDEDFRQVQLDFTGVTKLNLSSCGIIDLEVPKDISRKDHAICNVTHLLINDNSLTKLPNHMEGFVQLVLLDVRNNKDLTHIPVSLATLLKLQRIKIDGTGVTKIPSRFADFLKREGLFEFGYVRLELAEKWTEKWVGNNKKLNETLLEALEDDREDEMWLLTRTVPIALFGNTGAGKTTLVGSIRTRKAQTNFTSTVVFEAPASWVSEGTKDKRRKYIFLDPGGQGMYESVWPLIISRENSDHPYRHFVVVDVWNYHQKREGIERETAKTKDERKRKKERMRICLFDKVVGIPFLSSKSSATNVETNIILTHCDEFTDDERESKLDNIEEDIKDRLSHNKEPKFIRFSALLEPSVTNDSLPAIIEEGKTKQNDFEKVIDDIRSTLSTSTLNLDNMPKNLHKVWSCLDDYEDVLLEASFIESILNNCGESISKEDIKASLHYLHERKCIFLFSLNNACDNPLVCTNLKRFIDICKQSFNHENEDLKKYSGNGYVPFEDLSTHWSALKIDVRRTRPLHSLPLKPLTGISNGFVNADSPFNDSPEYIESTKSLPITSLPPTPLTDTERERFFIDILEKYYLAKQFVEADKSKHFFLPHILQSAKEKEFESKSSVTVYPDALILQATFDYYIPPAILNYFFHYLMVEMEIEHRDFNSIWKEGCDISTVVNGHAVNIYVQANKYAMNPETSDFPIDEADVVSGPRTLRDTETPRLIISVVGNEASKCSCCSTEEDRRKRENIIIWDIMVRCQKFLNEKIKEAWPGCTPHFSIGCPTIFSDVKLTKECRFIHIKWEEVKDQGGKYATQQGNMQVKEQINICGCKDHLCPGDPTILDEGTLITCKIFGVDILDDLKIFVPQFSISSGIFEQQVRSKLPKEMKNVNFPHKQENSDAIHVHALQGLKELDLSKYDKSILNLEDYPTCKKCKESLKSLIRLDLSGHSKLTVLPKTLLDIFKDDIEIIISKTGIKYIPSVLSKFKFEPGERDDNSHLVIPNISILKRHDESRHSEWEEMERVWEKYRNLDNLGPCIESYRMNKNEIKGIIAIINNMSYKADNSLFCNKTNSKLLRDIFLPIGFEVMEAKDLTGKQIEHFLYEVRERIKDKHSMFICALNGHGDEGCFLGVDWESVRLHKNLIGISQNEAGISNKEMILDKNGIIGIFDGANCSKFHSKPKVFFLDMCAGNEEEKKIMQTSKETKENPLQGFKLGKDADILVGRACTLGHVSTAGVYIPTLCKIIGLYHANESLLDIHSDVSRDVMENSKRLQTVNMVSTLHKKLYLGEKLDNLHSTPRDVCSVTIPENEDGENKENEFHYDYYQIKTKI